MDNSYVSVLSTNSLKPAFLFSPHHHAAPDLPGEPGGGQEVLCVDCMFPSCQRGRPHAQEQEEPDAARPLPRPEPLQGPHQVPEGQRAQVCTELSRLHLLFKFSSISGGIKEV